MEGPGGSIAKLRLRVYGFPLKHISPPSYFACTSTVCGCYYFTSLIIHPLDSMVGNHHMLGVYFLQFKYEIAGACRQDGVQIGALSVSVFLLVWRVGRNVILKNRKLLINLNLKGPIKGIIICFFPCLLSSSAMLIAYQLYLC